MNPPALPSRAARGLLVAARAALLAGVQPHDNATLRRKLIQVNAGAALAIATVLGYNGAFWLSGNAALRSSGLWQLPLVLLAPLVWWLNHRRHVVRARWCLMGLVMSDAVFAIVGGQGTQTQLHLYFILFAVLTPTLFAIEQRWGMLLLVVLNLAAYTGFERLGWPAHPALADLPAVWLSGLTMSMLLSCGLIVVLMAVLTEAASADNERRLQALAGSDALTGLANRRRFLDLLAREAARAAAQGEALAVAMLDIDHFKRVNDLGGHEAGDAALRHVATVVSAQLRPRDLLARIGGEEFALLLPQVPPGHALAVVERLRATLADSPFSHPAWSGRLSLSAGVAHRRPGEVLEALLRRADQALYRAKRQGRDRVCED